MQSATEVSGSDATSGRLLCRLSISELAERAGVSARTVARLEHGWPISEATRERVISVLAADGVRFHSPGIVHRPGYGYAPTRAAVGLMHGERIARGRKFLRMSVQSLASQAQVSMAAVRRLEKGNNLNLRELSPDLVAVVCALLCAGWRFGKRTRNHRPDAAVVPRPWPLAVRERAARRFLRMMKHQIHDLAAEVRLASKFPGKINREKSGAAFFERRERMWEIFRDIEERGGWPPEEVSPPREGDEEEAWLARKWAARDDRLRKPRVLKTPRQ